MKGYKTVKSHGHERAIGHCPKCKKAISTFVKMSHKKKH